MSSEHNTNHDEQTKDISTHGDGVLEYTDVTDLEECAKAGRKPPLAKIYRIRIDKQKYDVNASSLTGRELLELAGKCPPERHMISEKMHGGHAQKIGLDERADFTRHGVERFMTLPLDQTEG